MSGGPAFGNIYRWFIVKRDGVWKVHPPVTRPHGVTTREFSSGAEAIAAYAAGAVGVTGEATK